MQIRTKIFSVLLLAAAFNSTALNLGRVRGAAIVGQPLDIGIQAQLAPDESASSLCVEADVFHADTRQDPNRVRVTVEGGQQQTANIRVTSSSPIDEPVVTIYLKAGCNQKITRRYVLLADVPSEPAAPAPQNLPLVTAPAAVSPASPAASGSPVAPSADTGSAAQSSPTLPAAAATPAARPPAPKRAAAPAKPRPAAAKKPVEKAAPKAVEKPVEKPAEKTAEKPVTPAKTEAAAKPAPAKEEKPAAAKEAAPAKTKIDEKMAAGREAGQSRLKLDPLVSLAERVATLETTQATAPAPSAEALRDAQKVKALEDSVKTLVALAAKNEANMLEMRSQLQKAEAERLPMVWLYLLGGALLACLAALAYLLTRKRSGSADGRDDWWSGSKSAGLAASGAAASPSITTIAPSAHGDLRDAAPSTIVVQKPPPRATNKASLLEEEESEIDVSLVEMSESNFDNLMQSGQSHSALRRGPLPPAADNTVATRIQPMEVTRSINSEQIFDIRQQADFFVSLGQTDQAVRILENRINESGESSPLLYLDLLKIFHSLGLKQDYHQFREDFNLLFNSRVPEFSQYKEEGRSLEDYPHVLAHITALWTTPKAQMVIEASIFRDPMDDKSKPFDLAAFRDLLLLHAVGQSNARGDSGVSGLAPLSTVPVSPQRTTSISAKLAGASSVDIPLESPVSVMPPVPEGDLDLDLSDLVLPEPAAKSASGGASASPSSPKPAAAAKPGAASQSKAQALLDEEDTEFPKLFTTPPAAPAPSAVTPAKTSNATTNPPAQAIEDNNFLNFDKQTTMKYTLPKKKDGDKS